jgi:hypothetical protein
MNTRSAGFGAWARGLALLALTLSLFGCGGGSSSDALPGPQQPEVDARDTRDTPRRPGTRTPTARDAASGSVPRQWEAILTYVPPFYSGPYGSIPEGDGSIGIAFYFGPDGGYRHDWNLARAYFGGNCFQTAQWQESARRRRGPRLHLHARPCELPELRLVRSSSSTSTPCRSIPANHTLTLDQDATGWPLLRIGFPDRRARAREVPALLAVTRVGAMRKPASAGSGSAGSRRRLSTRAGGPMSSCSARTKRSSRSAGPHA